jgi:hypothetical protein
MSGPPAKMNSMTMNWGQLRPSAPIPIARNMKGAMQKMRKKPPKNLDGDMR